MTATQVPTNAPPVARRKEGARLENKKRLAAIVAIVAGAALAFPGTALAFQGSWATKAPMPTARVFAVGAEIGGILYVAGGHVGASDTAALEAYNPATNAWSSLAPMPQGRYGASAAVLNGQLYVIGGWHTGFCCPTSSVYVYDPLSNAWSTKASMPILSACSAAGAIGDKLYVLTACNGFGGYTSFLHVYDPVSNAWTQLASAPHVHSSPAAGVIGGKFYVAGGLDWPSGAVSATLDVYDPPTNTWSTLAPMQTPRDYEGGGVVGGKLYVAGGLTGTGPVATLEVYDPLTNTWSNQAPMSVARYGLVAAGIGGQLYAAGGATAGGNVTGALEVYTPGDLAISATGTSISATEGAPFSGVVASFSDPDVSATAAEYSATIDWGDGKTSSGTITSSGPGTFNVSGSNTYAEEGTYTITVVITDVDTASNSATALSRATVGDAALSGSCTDSTSLNAFNGVVQTFSDADPNGAVADYSATIDWGDSSSSAGTIAPSGTQFTVSGSHPYAATGSYTITVTTSDIGGSQTRTACKVLVASFAAGGSFVIGNLNSSSGTSVTFWGAQWAKLNSLSSGSAPHSFEGFAENSTPPSCGAGWSADPGNSTPPPDGPLPDFMAVIVTSSAGQSGSTISGDTLHIDIVQTNPGYAPNPGHAGTGTVIAQIC